MKRFAAFLAALLFAASPALAQQRSGPLIAHFNLSDLPNVATARANLGLGAAALLGINGTPNNNDCVAWVVSGGVPIAFADISCGGGGGGSVTSVNASGGSTGFTFSGGPITGSGTLTLGGGPLGIGFGGIGATSFSAANLPVFGSGLSATQCAYWTSTSPPTLGSTPCTGAGSFLPLAGGTMTGQIAGLNLSLSNAQGTDGGGLTMDVNGGVNTNAGQFLYMPNLGLRPIPGSHIFNMQDFGMQYYYIQATNPAYANINTNQYNGLIGGGKMLLEQANSGQIYTVNCKTASGYSPETISQWSMVEINSDGTNCIARGDLAGSFGLLNVQTFTGSGTYTPTAGTRFIIAEVEGGGAGGGGSAATGASQSSAAAGGSAGSYGKALISEGFSGQTVTIGAAGTGGAAGANAGGNGGTSSFGSLISCPGGVGTGNAGSAESAAAISGNATGGGAACTFATRVGPLTFTETSGSNTLTAGTSSTGLADGMLVFGTGIPAGTYVITFAGTSPNITVTLSQPVTGSGAQTLNFNSVSQIMSDPGGASLPGIAYSPGVLSLSGQGGTSFYGQPGAASVSAGNAATGYGSGGSGGATPGASGVGQAGGAGAAGIVIIEEYR